MRIFHAACMSEKTPRTIPALPAPSPGRARATCGCLARGRRFDLCFSIVVYNEKSSFWLNNA
jgi:hypothetical protein